MAAGLGIRKQTILHHFGSKEQLLTAVTDYTVTRLESTVLTALERSGSGAKRLERVIRAIFSLAAKEPELLAFARELARLGGVSLRRFTDLLAPLMERATSFIALGMGTESTQPTAEHLTAEVDQRSSVGQRTTEQHIANTNGEPEGRTNAHAIVLSVYAAILGAATEAEVRSSLGLAPSGRLLLRRRREVLAYITQLMTQPERDARSVATTNEAVAG